jgi:thymidylate synthase
MFGEKDPARIPTFHVIGDTIPEAWYKAIDVVWRHGVPIRTEYDRKDDAGNYIDPPSRDARVLIEVKDPFAQPRYPAISHCEIGTYIAEMIGAKDHRVLLMSVIKKKIKKLQLTAEENRKDTYWPYTYHQRLVAHPESDGCTFNQLANAIEMVAKTPYTRRAMCTTAVPNVDPLLVDDIPCLRELQLRCLEDANGDLVLNATTSWRSRDLYKAWGDNVIAITFLLARVADEIALQTGRKVRVGSYADFSMSCHIYGQDFSHVGGDKAQGLTGFFDNFPHVEMFVNKARSSECMRDLNLAQLEDLLSPRGIEQNEFPTESIELISDLIDGLESGRYIC